MLAHTASIWWISYAFAFGCQKPWGSWSILHRCDIWYLLHGASLEETLPSTRCHWRESINQNQVRDYFVAWILGLYYSRRRSKIPCWRFKGNYSHAEWDGWKIRTTGGQCLDFINHGLYTSQERCLRSRGFGRHLFDAASPAYLPALCQGRKLQACFFSCKKLLSHSSRPIDQTWSFFRVRCLKLSGFCDISKCLPRFYLPQPKQLITRQAAN